LVVGFAATFVAMFIGGGVGLLSGYFGRWVDVSLMRVTDYLLVIPDLVFMTVIAAVWGASLLHVILVIGILEWTSTARIIRAQAMSRRERVYVKRARALGAGNARIIWRHIMPQVGPLIIANTVLTIAIAIYLETALAFLGLEDPTVTTWGTILEHAFQRTAISYGAWWAIVPDGFMIAGLIVGCFLFGQAVEDALNPRLKAANLSVRRWRLRPLGGRGEGGGRPFEPAGGPRPACLVRPAARPAGARGGRGELRPGRGRALRPGRRVGLRQDHHDPGADGPAAAERLAGRRGAGRRA